MLMRDSSELLSKLHRTQCPGTHGKWMPMASASSSSTVLLLAPQGDLQLNSHADWDAHSPQHNAGEEVHIWVQATLDEVLIMSGNVLKLHGDLQQRIIPATNIRCA